MQHDQELDVRGANCPLPILRTKKALSSMSPGQLLRVVATDPNSVKDFEAFARQTGNELVFRASVPGEFVFVLRKRN